jgi:DNA-binding MarR family transcriptional regulator
MSGRPRCVKLPGYPMARDMAWPSVAPSADGNGHGAAEAGLAVLLEACERAVEELGSSVPPAQLRALLVIHQARSMNLSRLAAALGASASAASRLCDRMQAAGLLKRDRAAASRREIVLVPTESGRRLALWVAARRRAALADVLQSLTDGGQEALVTALGELALGPRVF